MWYQAATRVILCTLLTSTSLSITFGLVSGRQGSAARDLPQDYAAARAWLDGTSAFQPLVELYAHYGFPPPEDDVLVLYNPHPPMAILLSAPFALLSYDTAVQLVIWSQLVSLSLTWILSYELFQPQIREWIWSLAGGVFGLWAPVWQGLAWGQPVGFLALGVLGIWYLARCERAFAFGLLLASCVLVRPFIGLLIVLACSWSIRQQFRAICGLLVGGVLLFAAFGIWPWEWYQKASYAQGYVSACGSIPGVLNIGASGGIICFGIAIAILVALRRNGLSTDATWATASIAAMLIYPLAWYQYDTCLLPVAAWVLARITTTENRIALWTLTAYLLLRAFPALENSRIGEGLFETLARYQNWIQVIARGIFLGTVITVILKPSEGRKPPD